MNNSVEAYSEAPWLTRFLVAGRPVICPMEPIQTNIPPGSNVLDVGCGVGSLLISLAQDGRLVRGIGCDVNPTAISVAKRAALNVSSANLDFVTITSEKAIPAGPFEVVTLIDVMHHIPPSAQRTFFAACA